MSDLAFHYDRTAAAGAAEAAPTATTSDLVQQLLSAEQMRGERTDALVLLCSAVAIDYELGVWDTATSAFVVVATGSLVAGTPSVIPWPYQGAQMYLRHTNVIGAGSRIRAVQVRAPSAQLAATLAAVATEATLAAMSAKLPATIGQKVKAASLAVTLASDEDIATTLTNIASHVQRTPIGAMSAAADSGQIGAGAVEVGPVLAANISGDDLYLQFFDAGALPADGAAPDYEFPIAAGQTLEPHLYGAAFATACFWCASTTQGTKTITATAPIRLGAGTY